jgi:hypothetical protein
MCGTAHGVGLLAVCVSFCEFSTGRTKECADEQSKARVVTDRTLSLSCRDTKPDWFTGLRTIESSGSTHTSGAQQISSKSTFPLVGEGRRLIGRQSSNFALSTSELVIQRSGAKDLDRTLASGIVS